MITARRARILLTSAALAALAACETPAPPAPPPPPAPVAVAPPVLPPVIPTPPPPPPAVALSTQIIEDASTFRAYMAATSAISPDFKDANQVAEGLRTASAFEKGQLEQGAIAFAAVTALQQPDFVASVRKFAVDKAQREDLTEKIIAEPGYAAGFANADKAAGLIIASLDASGAKVMIAGKAVKQAAYDVQHQAWSKTNVVNPEGRLSDTKNRSGQRILASLTDVDQLRKASLQGAAQSLSGDPVQPPYQPVVIHGLAVAALAALGQAGDDKLDRVMPLLTEESSAYCLTMSKLNLYQCLAVSKPHYEDIFCLGQHSMMDIGQCVIKAAGSPNPVFVEPPPPPAPAKVVPTRTSTAKKRK